MGDYTSYDKVHAEEGYHVGARGGSERQVIKANGLIYLPARLTAGDIVLTSFTGPTTKGTTTRTASGALTTTGTFKVTRPFLYHKIKATVKANASKAMTLALSLNGSSLATTTTTTTTKTIKHTATKVHAGITPAKTQTFTLKAVGAGVKSLKWSLNTLSIEALQTVYMYTIT